LLSTTKLKKKDVPCLKGEKYLGPSFGFFVGSPLEGRDLASINDNQFRVLLFKNSVFSLKPMCG
jgi:hypothetical protein